MTNFFKNLISRHVPLGSGESTISVVSPRPKYKFEEDNATASNTGMESNLVSSPSDFKRNTEPVENVSNSITQSEPALHRSDTQFSDSDTGPVPEVIVPPDGNSELVSFKTEIGINQNSANIDRFDNSIKQNTLGTHENAQKTSGVFNDLAGASNSLQHSMLQDQVDSILQRINETNINPYVVPRVSSFGFKNELASSDNTLKSPFENSGDLSNSDSPSELNRASENLSSISEQAHNRETVSEGVLNTPVWLSEMETSLNQQLQKLNQHKNTPEPVVNVTIGRVEVRAIQANPTKKQNLQKKPNGVMSLDEYLQQRKDKGQA